MFRKASRSSAAAIVFGLITAPCCLAANEVVQNCANDVELRADLTSMQATTGGTLTFNCGNATIALTSVLPPITKDTTINGADKIAISGVNSSRVFVVDAAGKLTLQNIVVTNGSSGSDGGAIYSAGPLVLEHATIQNSVAVGSGGAIVAYGKLTITDSVLKGNKGANGGAIFPRFAAAEVTITDSELLNNEATDDANGWGGAVLLWDGATVNITGSRLQDNEANLGGAIYNAFANSSITVESSNISDNEATAGDGGGIFSQGGSLTMSMSYVGVNIADASGGGLWYAGGTHATITASTFASNESSACGGGMAFANASGVALVNVTFSSNSAERGGALCNFESTVAVANGTMFHNSASNGASGIDNNTTASKGTTLLNTILASVVSGENCRDRFADTIVSADGNLSADDSCDQYLNKAHDLSGEIYDPMLEELVSNGGSVPTLVPQPGSDALDAGIATGAPSIDARGVTRPQGAAYDIGAVEVRPCSGPGGGLCGDATGDGSITASDSLRALRAAVGSASCELYQCDFNGDGSLTASDSLGILRKAVGQAAIGLCPAAWDCRGVG